MASETMTDEDGNKYSILPPTPEGHARILGMIIENAENNRNRQWAIAAMGARFALLEAAVDAFNEAVKVAEAHGFGDELLGAAAKLAGAAEQMREIERDDH